MSATTTRTGVGGESAPPTYEYLRTRLNHLFLFAGAAALTYDVLRNGQDWEVAAGVVEAPHRSWDGYGVVFRATNTPTGMWYEADLQNRRGEPVIGFGFAPEGGYQVLQYDVEDGAVRNCLEEASEGHIALATELIDLAVIDEEQGLQAAAAFTQTSPSAEGF
jgi:hypothetical protein